MKVNKMPINGGDKSYFNWLNDFRWNTHEALLAGFAEFAPFLGFLGFAVVAFSQLIVQFLGFDT